MTARSSRPRTTRWLPMPMAIALIAVSLLVPVTSAAAEPTDMVLEWNINAVATIGNPGTATTPGLGQPPPLAPLHLAMVHGAIYDAVNAIVETHEPYLDGLDAPAGSSQAAAVAAAAYGVLVGLTPSTSTGVLASLDSLYAASLAKIPDGSAKAAGIVVGQAAASAMLVERTGDGRFGTYVWPTSSQPQPGEWRPVSPQNASVFAWVAHVKPFTLESADQYRIGAPYALTSVEYAADFNEVKAVGGTSSTRTPRQAELAAFTSVNPFAMVNRGLREIAAAKGLSTSEQARLFVMTSMSTADSLISCWENKDHWMFWRPQTAIQQGDLDGNPATVADPSWTSFVANPGYPDAPSGYNCLVAGAIHAARAYFGSNRMTFSLTSVGATPVTRHYRQFSGAIKDAIDGRVYIGIHFRRADEQGAWLGMKVARWATTHYFGVAD